VHELGHCQWGDSEISPDGSHPVPIHIKINCCSVHLADSGVEFKQWHKTCGSLMTQLPWTMYAYLESMCVCLGNCATHFTNVSIYHNKGQITDLDMKPLIKIIAACNHMIHHFEGLFSTGTSEVAIHWLIPHTIRGTLSRLWLWKIMPHKIRLLMHLPMTQLPTSEFVKVPIMGTSNMGTS